MNRKDNIYVLSILMCMIMMCIYIYKMPSYQFKDAKEYEEQMRLESEHESIANVEKNETLTMFEPYVTINPINDIESESNKIEETQEIIELEKTEELIDQKDKGLISSVTLESVTDEEFYEICRVVMNESGGEPYQTQVAVAETIVNRVNSPEFPDTVMEVLNQPWQYSHCENGEVTDSVREAVTQALEQHIYDTDMVYFRDWYYHEFAEDYFYINNMYFSKGGH